MENAISHLDRRLRARDLDQLPHEWDTRYELIGGTLYMSRRPSHEHQQILLRIALKIGPAVLEAGGDAVQEPGILWEDDGEDNVSPDFVLLLRTAPPPRGEKLRTCPDIIIEVLSPGDENRRRDLEAKRDLYWRRGALEYWIVDPERRSVLKLVRGPTAWEAQELDSEAILTTVSLPRWGGVRVAELFPGAA